MTNTDEKKKKVLLLIDWLPEKGCSLADALRENNLDCDVMGTDFPIDKWTPLKKVLFHWTRCCWLGYRAFLKRKDYDFVLAWQQIMGLAFGVLKFFTFSKKKLFILLTNITERSNPLLAALRKLYIKFAWSRVDFVGFYSLEIMNRIVKSFDLPEKKAVHLPMAHNVKKFSYSQEPDLNSYIYSVGISYRDYPTLIKAARQSSEKQFVIVTQEFALKGLDIPPNVKIYKNTFGEKARELMQQAAVVVLPLIFTDSPAGEATLLEAMSYGKPTIVTRTITTKEYVQDKVNGLLVPRKDANAITEAIDFIYADENRSKQIGSRARERVCKEYSVEAFAKRVAAVVHDI